MAGFNFQPPAAPAQQAANPAAMMPFQLLSPQMLAQIAQAAFRPPGGGMGGGMGGGGGGAPASPGMNFAGMPQALGGLADAYVKWRGAGTGGAPGPGAMLGEDRATAPQWPPPMGDSTSTVQPLTNLDFFNGNASSSLGYGSFGGFGSGSAAISPSFIGGGASGFGGG